MIAVETELSAGRIRERLDELAKIGADPRGGVTRLAYTEAEREAHRLFAEWAEEDGARIEVDDAGNTIAIFNEGTPYFLFGSHLDSVIQGGIYDGAAGVVGGLEAARSLQSEIQLGLRVVVFAAEEGARFGRPTLGSTVAAGFATEEMLGTLRDADGASLLDAAEELGFDLLGARPWINGDVACFFEIHIEQGRQLEAGAARVGLVDAIAGSVRMRFTIKGRADHSGATPMHMRHDALTATSELALEVEKAGRSYRSTVATIGKLEVFPNSVTTVPGQVTAWVDIRDVDADVQRQTASRVLAAAERIQAERDVSIDSQVISELPPVVLEAWPRALAHERCEELGLSYRVLSSGAGHDAAIVARQAPATMFFIPCADGVSHSPRESASATDIAEAARLISATALHADGLLGGIATNGSSAEQPDSEE